MRSNLYLKLFISFFKIGAFTFGGGWAMIPLIEREVVDKQNWITRSFGGEYIHIDRKQIARIKRLSHGDTRYNSTLFSNHLGYCNLVCSNV